MEDNVKRFLQRKVGVNDKMKSKVINDIFGRNGPLSCTDIVDFEAEIVHLVEEYEQHLPNFIDYFKYKLVPLLRSYVFVPHLQKNSIPIDWKNNACEAMNHIMKLAINWKPSKLPSLIHNLHEIVKLQYIDVERSFTGQGNYQLAPWVSKSFRFHPQVWASKPDEEKESIFQKFLSWKQRKYAFITSSDEKLRIP